MDRTELEVLLQFINDCTATSVDAEVIKCKLEVRYIRLDFGIEELLGNKSGEEEELLADREDERAKGGDVGLEGAAGDGHEIFGQGHTDLSYFVLLLIHAAERIVIGSLVRAHDVDEPVLGAAAVGPAVRQKHRSTADAEQTIGDKHRLPVPKVPVLRDVLGGDDDSVGGAMHLEKITSEVDGYDAGTAAHATEIEAPDVAAEFVLVNDHGGERRGGIEKRAINNKNTNILGIHTSGAKQIV